MKVWLGKDVQTKLAVGGLSIPMVKGTADAIQNPFYKALALKVNKTGWIGLAMDQLFGRETGRVFNDEALAVAAGGKISRTGDAVDRKLLVPTSDLGMLEVAIIC